MPHSEVYEQEFRFMPWGKLIREVLNYLVEHTPQGGSIVDLMCGPGYLLSKLNRRRPDLNYLGVDLSKEFILRARKVSPQLRFINGNVENFVTDQVFDVVVCTGGVHHLTDDAQYCFVSKIAQMVCKGGFAVIADPYIDDYSSHQKRMISSAKLGYEYLLEVIRKGAPADVIDATIQVLRNDVLLLEWKTSVKKRIAILERFFKNVEVHKTWPDHETGYGDYYFVVRG